MDEKLKLIVDSFGKDRFKFNESLKDYTVLKVGGPTKLFFIAFTTSELIKAAETCRQLKVPFFVFGTGTKIMISYESFDGLVIKNRTKNIHTISVKGKVSKVGVGIEEALVEVDSGVSINKFVEYLTSAGLTTSGLEGIPGTIGGNILINRFLQKSAKSIKVLDQTNEVEEIEASALRTKLHIILSVVFRVKAKNL